MTVNIDLLTRTVQWAIDERVTASKGEKPQPIVVGNVAMPGLRWDQGSWAYGEGLDPVEPGATWCGTACCLAGNVAILDFYQHPRGWAAYRDRAGTEDIEFLVGDWIDKTDPGGMGISSYAQDRLGLTNDQASFLFSGGNSIEQVIGIAQRIAMLETGRPLVLDYEGLDEGAVEDLIQNYADHDLTHS